MLKASQPVSAQLGFILAWLKPRRCSLQPGETTAGCWPGLRDPSLSPHMRGARPAAPWLGALMRHRRCPREGPCRQAVGFPCSSSTEGSPGAAASAAEVKGALVTCPGLGTLSGEPRADLCPQGCAAGRWEPGDAGQRLGCCCPVSPVRWPTGPAAFRDSVLWSPWGRCPRPRGLGVP